MNKSTKLLLSFIVLTTCSVYGADKQTPAAPAAYSLVDVVKRGFKFLLAFPQDMIRRFFIAPLEQSQPKPITLPHEEAHEGVAHDCCPIKQHDVLSQTDGSVARSSGGASCGYHALKNGILLAQNNVKALTDADLADDLFCLVDKKSNLCMGFWRREIVFKRLKTKLKTQIEQDCLEHFVMPDIDKESCAYSVVKNVMSAVANHVAQTIVDNGSSAIAHGQLIAALQNIVVDTRPTDDEYTNAMRVARTAVKKNPYNYLVANSKPLTYGADIVDAIMNSYQLDGDWISGSEIEHIIEIERKHGMLLQNNNIGITVLDGASLLTNPDIAPCDINAIKQKFNKDSSYKHLFVVGTMDYDYSTGSGAQGHWFTVVVGANGCRVADSLANTNRCYDSRVKTILELLGSETLLKASKEQTTLVGKKLDTLADAIRSAATTSKQQALQIEFMNGLDEYTFLGGNAKPFTEKLNNGMAQIRKPQDNNPKRLAELTQQIQGIIGKYSGNPEDLQIALIEPKEEFERLGGNYAPFALQVTAIARS